MSTFGKFLEVSIFGESHGQVMGVTIHNLPAGIVIDTEKIKNRLSQRRGLKGLSTARKEDDKFEIVSGYFEDATTGAPLTVLLYNSDTRSGDYQRDIARPSHADYVAYKKYHGDNDYRGGGHFSGRITALLVILGAICEDGLRKYRINVVSRVKQIKTIVDHSPLTSDAIASDEVFPVVDELVKKQMSELIKDAKESGDSVGGVLETHCYNLPVGLGEPFFDSFESIISHLVFSIPGVKGIEFGAGFAISELYGSQANDQMQIVDGAVKYLSNNSGGINGGITNGNVVTFKTAIKPTPSIERAQQTINFVNNKSTTIEVKGRHDPVIAIKAVHVVNALCYYAIFELLLRNKVWR